MGREREQERYMGIGGKYNGRERARMIIGERGGERYMEWERESEREKNREKDKKGQRGREEKK
jgi:hypothetical protein